MNKGVALEFKRRFRQTEELKKQNTSVAEIASTMSEGRTIIYLITKELYWQKPTYKNVFQTLIHLRNYCTEKDLTFLKLLKTLMSYNGLKFVPYLDIFLKVPQKNISVHERIINRRRNTV